MNEGWPTRERVLDELPFGILVARAPAGEVLYTNQSFRTILGMEAVSGVEMAAAPATYRIFDRQGNAYPADKLAFSRALATDDVTRQLKTFTRPDDEQLTPINVACIVRSVLGLLRKEIDARARLVEEIGDSPPVLANDARLVQVLTNLLMNAWQAVPASDPANQVIGVRTGALDGNALIEVWDSGKRAASWNSGATATC